MTDTGQTTRVLIIDADNVRRGMLACSLPATRYVLEFANNDEKGLDLLGRVRPGVVILGWSSRSDLCQRIRSLPGGRSCAVLLMDERFRDQSVGRGEMEAAGADDFLPFPFELERLDTAIAQLRRRPAHPTRDSAPTGAPFADHAARGATATDVAAPESDWAAFRARVDEIHANLDSATYYQLLEVPQTVSPGAVKQAFFDRSIEFHPDRFLQLEDQELRDRIYEVFKRMSEAFKVLSSPQARSQYDGNLAGPTREVRYLERDEPPSDSQDPSDDARTPSGKKFLRHAILAEAEGNLRSARMYLSMAVQCEPDNESLQARLDVVTGRLGI